MNDINAKVDGMYNDIHGKFEALNTHMRVSGIKVGQTSALVKTFPGTFTRMSETNPKEYINAITLINRKEVETKQ